MSLSWYVVEFCTLFANQLASIVEPTPQIKETIEKKPVVRSLVPLVHTIHFLLLKEDRSKNVSFTVCIQIMTFFLLYSVLLVYTFVSSKFVDGLEGIK